jgi:hypothetical protein
MTKWAFEELLIPSVVSKRFFGILMSDTTNLCIAFLPLFNWRSGGPQLQMIRGVLDT